MFAQVLWETIVYNIYILDLVYITVYTVYILYIYPGIFVLEYGGINTVDTYMEIVPLCN